MLRCLVIGVACVLPCGCEPSPDAYDPKPTPVELPRPEHPNSAPPLPTHPGATPGEAPVVRVPARSKNSDALLLNPLNPLQALKTHDEVKQQLLFDVSIPKAIEVFEGLRNRKVSSHQEFMTEILVKNGIQLPALPPQHRYFYDVRTGELMIEKPVDAD